jgi:hypothetical protein
MLEKKLQEELNRYNAINKYGKTMIIEQEAPTDPAPELPPAGPTDDATAPMDTAAPLDAAAPSPEMDNTEEIDITDLVDMTKSIKRDLENKQQDQGIIVSKMDDVFTKLSDLEQKLAQMDQVMAKIDQLSIEVQQVKPETPVEKLEMRSLDSYPFNEKPAEFFDHKQDEMRASGKNEYILTKDDVENYDPTIMTSFNPEEDKDEYSY